MPKPGINITPGLPKVDNSHGDLLERSMDSNSESWPMFSYSQSQVWDRCEYSWHLSYRKGWTRNWGAKGMAIGTKVHEGMDVFYGNECSYDAVDAWMRSELEEIEDVETLDVFKRAAYILKIYCQEEAPRIDKGHLPVSTEISVTVPMVTPKGRNYWFNGYVDLLMKYGIDKYKVIDHKTTSQGFWKIAGVKMDPQNVLYAAALREQGFNVTHTSINMLNTYPYVKMMEVAREKLFLRLEVVRTDRELDNAIKQFGNFVDQLLDRYTTPRKSLRKSCEDCQFQEPCHLGQIGMNQKPILLANYKKKEGTFDGTE